jgi:serine/threonine protein kinase/Tfp pilus assembly protein PilF
MIGDTILHYKILEKLGQGGMGVVYLAEDINLERKVAIKFLPKYISESTDERQRFKIEAKAAAKLNHPNIATIYSIEETDNELFIVMEYIKGKELKEYVGTGHALSLQKDKIVKITAQIAEGLEAAHKEGIIHRDIKSSNIMITDSGVAKIMDFGLAKVKGTSKLTKIGSTVGTIAYMSPEQSRSDEVDNRTDIWSLGVVLYEMLTGKLPFRGDYDQAIIYSILNEEPEPVKKHLPDIDPALSGIISKALKKEPGDRYQSMKEIVTELMNIRNFSNDDSITKLPSIQTQTLSEIEDKSLSQVNASASQKRKLIMVAAGFLTVVLIVAGYFLLFDKSNATNNSASIGKSIAVLPFENLSADKSNAYFADGMQDMILTKLADIGDLKVISRTSTEKYKSHPEDLKTIAKQLGVATILEGSVQKAGDQVLINVQLIDAHNDNHIWANSYTRTLQNIFGVEGEVAQKVADALNAKLTAKQTNAVTNVPTTNQVAYDAYLRGEYYYTKVLAGNFNLLTQVVNSYKQAVESDSSFALAWAKLAYSQSLLMYASMDRSDSTAKNALANAQRSLRLDPNLSYGHFALGYIYRMDFAEYGKALNEFEQALEGLPNNAEVLAAIAYIDDLHGELQAASNYLQKAILLNPNDPNLALSYGYLLTYLGRYSIAGSAFNRMLAIAPEDPEGYSSLAQNSILDSGNVDSAMAILDKAPPDVQLTPDILYERAYLLLLKRAYSKAAKIAETLQPGGRFITKLQILLLRAEVSGLTNDKKSAQDNFRKALAEANNHYSISINEKTFKILLGKAIAQAGLKQKDTSLKTLDSLVSLLEQKGLKPYTFVAELVRARIYAMIGDDGDAVAELNRFLSSPNNGFYSINLIRLDPIWDPLRNDSAFQTMINKYSRKNI